MLADEEINEMIKYYDINKITSDIERAYFSVTR